MGCRLTIPREVVQHGGEREGGVEAEDAHGVEADELRVAGSVFGDAGGVVAAIDFDDQLQRSRVEIDDERRKNMLATELDAAKAAIAERLPEHCLGSRGRFAMLPSEFRESEQRRGMTSPLAPKRSLHANAATYGMGQHQPSRRKVDKVDTVPWFASDRPSAQRWNHSPHAARSAA